MDVINYYVTVEHENELARRRVATPPPPPPPPPEDELPHNTVVALPQINRLVTAFSWLHATEIVHRAGGSPSGVLGCVEPTLSSDQV